MFSGKHPQPQDKNGRYFIDADGDTFVYILRYLRHKQLPPKDMIEEVYRAAQYFGPQDLLDELEGMPQIALKKVSFKLHVGVNIEVGLLLAIPRSWQSTNGVNIWSFKYTNFNQVTFGLLFYVMAWSLFDSCWNDFFGGVFFVPFVIVVSFPHLKLWVPPNIGWEGSTYNRFPLPVQTVIHTSAVLPVTLWAALQLKEFQ